MFWGIPLKRQYRSQAVWDLFRSQQTTCERVLRHTSGQRMWCDPDSWRKWLCLRLACWRLLIMLNDLFSPPTKWFCRKNKKTDIAPIWCRTINSYAWFIVHRHSVAAIYVIQDHRHVSLFVVIITIISVTFIITIISVTFPTDYISALFVIVVIMLQCIPYTTH